MCTLVPAVACAWILDCEGFGDGDAGRTFTVDGVLFGFVPAPPGAYPIDAWSSARTWAITNAINDHCNSEVRAKNDDGRVQIFGRPGLKVTSDAPGVVPNLLTPGGAARCEP